MLKKLYVALGTTIILGYAATTFMGYEFGDAERDYVPPDVRQSPGGYRSFHFWHSGYHGGK